MEERKPLHCRLRAEKKAVKKPYSISAGMTIEKSNIYENAGLDFEFYNKSEKTVVSFTIVFLVYDFYQDFSGDESGNISLEVFAEIKGRSEIEDCISLDGLFSEVPEETYQLDYLYVSRIIYSDGSEWTDSSGRYAVYF